ncbi:hypothetical protein ACVWXQ_006699 [Bradyrhizobium sp. S3.14.4]
MTSEIGGDVRRSPEASVKASWKRAFARLLPGTCNPLMSSFATTLVRSFPNGRCCPIRISFGVMIHTTAGASMMPTTNAAPTSSAATETITSNVSCVNRPGVKHSATAAAKPDMTSRCAIEAPSRRRMSVLVVASSIAGADSVARETPRTGPWSQATTAAAAIRPQLLAFSSFATVRSISS